MNINYNMKEWEVRDDAIKLVKETQEKLKPMIEALQEIEATKPEGNNRKLFIGQLGLLDGVLTGLTKNIEACMVFGE